MSSCDDPVFRDDGTTAEVESAAVLQGHLPRDLTKGGLGASNNLTSGLEDLRAAELVYAT
jgi:hypothetical protein